MLKTSHHGLVGAVDGVHVAETYAVLKGWVKIIENSVELEKKICL